MKDRILLVLVLIGVIDCKFRHRHGHRQPLEIVKRLESNQRIFGRVNRDLNEW